MNTTIQLLKNHRSYRDFDENYLLTTEEQTQILDAARQAPSWMNGQFYSIIVVTDQASRQKLVDLNPTNPQILKSSLFLVFVADLKRTHYISESQGETYVINESLNPLIIATTDASLALQNAIIASEALGFGTVPVGSIRNHIAEVSELLGLPDYVFPLCGLCIGKPTLEMRVKPRLPQDAVIHINTYQPYNEASIDAYTETMIHFAEKRETKTWIKKFTDYFSQKPTNQLNRYLKKQKIIR